MLPFSTSIRHFEQNMSPVILVLIFCESFVTSDVQFVNYKNI